MSTQDQGTLNQKNTTATPTTSTATVAATVKTPVAAAAGSTKQTAKPSVGGLLARTVEERRKQKLREKHGSTANMPVTTLNHSSSTRKRPAEEIKQEEESDDEDRLLEKVPSKKEKDGNSREREEDAATVSAASVADEDRKMALDDDGQRVEQKVDVGATATALLDGMVKNVQQTVHDVKALGFNPNGVNLQQLFIKPLPAADPIALNAPHCKADKDWRNAKIGAKECPRGCPPHTIEGDSKQHRSGHQKTYHLDVYYGNSQNMKSKNMVDRWLFKNLGDDNKGNRACVHCSGEERFWDQYFNRVELAAHIKEKHRDDVFKVMARKFAEKFKNEISVSLDLKEIMNVQIPDDKKEE